MVLHGLNPWARFLLGPFSQANLAASATNNQSPAAGIAGVKHLVLDQPAWLTGISLMLENGGTLGTVTVTPFIDDVDPGVAYDLAMADSATDADAFLVYSVPIFLPAGTRLSIRYTTTADWNGTNGDINVMLSLRLA